MRPVAGKIVVFAGPSVGRTDQLVSDEVFTFLPPIQRGELFAFFEAPPAGVLIIDGYFGSRPSVLHQEILSLLRMQVPVFGAGSMGALRAVELASSGMIGLGKVYEMYATGELTGDDEVALLHGPAEVDYMPLSIALVELRVTLAALISARTVTGEEAQYTISAMEELPFHERTWDKIDALDRHVSPHFEKPIGARLRRGWIAQKTIDARCAIAAVSGLGLVGPTRNTSSGSSTLIDSQALEQITVNDTKLSHADIIRTASLFLPDFPRIRSDVARITLFAQHARHMRLTDDSATGCAASRDHSWSRQVRDARSLEDEHRLRFPHSPEYDLWHRCVRYAAEFEEVEIGPALLDAFPLDDSNDGLVQIEPFLSDPHGMFPKYWLFCEIARRGIVNYLMPIADYIFRINESIHLANSSFRITDLSESYLLDEFCDWKAINTPLTPQVAYAHGYDDVADAVDAFRFAHLALKLSRISSDGRLPHLIENLVLGKG